MSFVLGLDGKAYRNTATHASPTWTEIENIQDAALNLTGETDDVTIRGGSGWRLNVTTLLDGSVDFGMVYDTDDADFEAIQSAFFNKTTLLLAFMDGDITTNGSEGLRAPMAVNSFGRTENLAEAMKVPVTVSPTYFVESSAIVAPDWYEVGA